jgi:hypothetical protein
LFKLKPHNRITANVPNTDKGRASAGISVGSLAQEKKDDQHNERRRYRQLSHPLIF